MIVTHADRIMLGHRQANNRMTCFVISGQLLFSFET